MNVHLVLVVRTPAAGLSRDLRCASASLNLKATHHIQPVLYHVTRVTHRLVAPIHNVLSLRTVSLSALVSPGTLRAQTQSEGVWKRGILVIPTRVEEVLFVTKIATLLVTAQSLLLEIPIDLVLVSTKIVVLFKLLNKFLQLVCII